MSWSAIGGTPGGAPAYGPLAGPTTFTFAPVGSAQVGDLILLEVTNDTGATNTSVATALSSSNATWSAFGAGFTGSTNNGFTTQVFAGVLTSTSSATVTITWSSTAPSAHVNITGSGFRSTAGAWTFDTAGHIDSAGTSTWASLTPAGTGELYFGFALNSVSATAGSTSGVVYEIDSNGNGVAYDLNVSAALAPVWSDSTQVFGGMVLVQEAPPLPTAAPQPGSRFWQSTWRKRQQIPPQPNPGGTISGIAQPGSPTWQRQYRHPQQIPPVVPPAAAAPQQQVPTFTGRHPLPAQQGTRSRTWGPVPSGDQVTTPVPTFTGRSARPYQQPRRGRTWTPVPPGTPTNGRPGGTFIRQRTPLAAVTPRPRHQTVTPIPPGTPTNGYPGGTFTGRSSRIFPQPRRARWFGPVPLGTQNVPPTPYTTFTGRHPDLGVKPRRGKTWTPVPPGTPTIGREGGSVTPSRRFPALPQRARFFRPVPPGDQVTAPVPQFFGRAARLYQQPRRGRVAQPAPAPAQFPAGREAWAWVSRRFPAQWRRSRIAVVPRPPAGGAPIIPSTGLGGTVTPPAYGGTVTLPGYGGTITLPGYGGVVTLPGWGGTITPGGPVVAVQQDVPVIVADDEFLGFAVTNNGVPVNLTGYGVTVYLKANRYQANASAIATYTIGSGITIVSLPGGTFTLDIPKTQLPVPAAQWYRCDLTDGSGNVYTALYGNLTVQAI